jgi:hypothetical protein
MSAMLLIFYCAVAIVVVRVSVVGVAVAVAVVVVDAAFSCCNNCCY